MLPLEKGVGGIFPNGHSTKNANLPDHSFRDAKFMLGKVVDNAVRVRYDGLW